MWKFLHNAAERIRSRRQGRTGTGWQIVWNDAAVQVKWLTLENDAGSVSFSWDSVLAVDTFKRDLFAVDCFYLAFQLPGGWMEVNEEMKGWADFLTTVGSRLPGFPPLESWLWKVSDPAFKSNRTRLWTKETGAHK
jgi:hypothetical protein